MTMLQEKAVQMIQNMSDENVGFLIEIACYKFLTAGKDVNLKENEEEQTDPVLKDAISVFKHFKISFIVPNFVPLSSR